MWKDTEMARETNTDTANTNTNKTKTEELKNSTAPIAEMKADKLPAIKLGDMDEKTIDANIQKIGNNGRKLHALIQETLVGILCHHALHGDYSRLDVLYGVLNSNVSKNVANAMVTFVEAHSYIQHRPTKPDGTRETGFKKKSGKPNAFKFRTDDKTDDDGKVTEAGSNVEITKDNFAEMSAKMKECSALTDHAGFMLHERVWTPPKADDFLKRMESFLSAAKRMRDQATEGVEKPGTKKRVIVRHQHIDDTILNDLALFMVQHGMDKGKAGEILGKPIETPTQH